MKNWIIDYSEYHKNRIYEYCFIVHCFEEKKDKICFALNTLLLTLLLEITHATYRLVINLLADNLLICRLH